MSILPVVASEVLEMLESPIDFVQLERLARESDIPEIATMPHHSLTQQDLKNKKGRWGVAWTLRDYFGCVQFATILGRVRGELSRKEICVLNRGGWALKTLELFWCQNVQVDDPENAPVQPDEFQIHMHRFDFRGLVIMQYLQEFTFEQYTPRDTPYALMLLLDCAASEFESLCRGGTRINERGEIRLQTNYSSFARAFHFMCGTTRVYSGSVLESTFAKRIGQEMHLVVQDIYEQTGCDTVVYSFTELERAIRINPHMSCSRQGLHVSEYSARAWRVLWLTALQEVARDERFSLEPVLYFRKLEDMEECRALEQVRDKAIAVRRQSRNLLRVRALRPAFRLAANDLCSLVLQFMA